MHPFDSNLRNIVMAGKMYAASACSKVALSFPANPSHLKPYGEDFLCIFVKQAILPIYPVELTPLNQIFSQIKERDYINSYKHRNNKHPICKAFKVKHF